MEFKIVSKHDRSVSYEADILVNKVLEAHNTDLIKTYAMLDTRFRDLCLILKYLNKYHFPSASNRLNSYSIVLMTLAYLQHEGILPILQQSTEKQPLKPHMIDYMK